MVEKDITRRDWLALAVAGGIVYGSKPGRIPALQARESQAEVDFGFTLYGMRSVPLAEAIRVCGEIGYNSLELACLKDWPADPDLLTAVQRRDLRSQLQAANLDLASLMDNLAAHPSDVQHLANLERIKRLAELAHAVNPGTRTPILETVLGGKPTEWEQVRERFAVRLQDWADVAHEHELQLALKPHVGGALHTPGGAQWLAEHIASPSGGLAYDYSHFVLRGLSLAESWEAMRSQTRFIHLKDAQGSAAKFQFQLPGEQGINYVDYFALLRRSNYRGPVVVEVSGQISSQPGYEPVAAAKICYTRLAPVFEKTGLARRKLA